MEKEYVEALLKDLDKTYSTEEKFHLITVFVTELSNYQNKTTEMVEGVSETLTKVQKVFETLNDSNEKLFLRIVDAENRLSRLEVNFELPRNGKKTELEKLLDQIYKSQADTAKVVQENLKRYIKQTREEIKLHEHINKLYKHIERIQDRMDKMERDAQS